MADKSKPENYNEKILTNTALLRKHMEALIQASSLKSPDRYTTAASTFQLNIHADQIIKAAEDLLALSRTLKEAWVLSTGSMDAKEGEEEDMKEDARVVGDALRGWCARGKGWKDGEREGERMDLGSG